MLGRKKENMEGRKEGRKKDRRKGDWENTRGKEGEIKERKGKKLRMQL